MALNILLADAAHDENGKDGYEGSRAGDQTGDEVRNINYRKVVNDWNRPETRVFRCKRADIREAYTIRIQQTVDNSHIGYSQKNRRTYYEQMVNDYDPSHIRKDVECDCSCLVNTCVWVTLKSVNHPETSKIYPLARTIDMPKLYGSCSEFEDATALIDLATGRGLQRGDILVIPNKHTAVVWDVVEIADPVVKYDGYATTTVFLRTAPSALAQKCNIQLIGEGIRNYLLKDEGVIIIAESGNWYQIKIDGYYTWTPWVNKKYIKRA